jgi:acetyltransferase
MSAKKEQRLEESWKRLRRIFFPKSVVLIGVSSAPSNLARVIVRNLTDLKFNGQVFCVGAGGGSIGGCCIYRSLEEVPATPDLAVLLIAASHIPATLEICGKKGVHDVVVETAGFCEFDEQRKYLEQEILDVARRWDITILGPNCIGVINMENGMALPFMPLDYRDMKKGSVSIISQSGGLLHDIVRRCCLENIGLSKVISIGNKMMLDENDFIGTLTADPSTQVIGIYLEDIRDGRMLMELSASCPKPVVALKSNTSGSSAEIARFHTSAVAVDDAVVSAAFRQCGIHRVESLAEMMDLFKTFSLPLLRGHKLLLLSRSSLSLAEEGPT